MAPDSCNCRVGAVRTISPAPGTPAAGAAAAAEEDEANSGVWPPPPATLPAHRHVAVCLSLAHNPVCQMFPTGSATQGRGNAERS